MVGVCAIDSQLLAGAGVGMAGIMRHSGITQCGHSTIRSIGNTLPLRISLSTCCGGSYLGCCYSRVARCLCIVQQFDFSATI